MKKSLPIVLITHLYLNPIRKKNKYNQIIQDIIENESQKEVDVNSDLNDEENYCGDDEESQTYSKNNNQDTSCPHQEILMHFLVAKIILQMSNIMIFIFAFGTY